jgi:hypothetical protein
MRVRSCVTVFDSPSLSPERRVCPQLMALLDRDRGRVTTTVVISPLLALIIGQMKTLPGHPPLVAATMSSAASDSEKARTLAELTTAGVKLKEERPLIEGDVPRVLFLTPEAVVGDQHLQTLLQNLCAKVSRCQRVALFRCAIVEDASSTDSRVCGIRGFQCHVVRESSAACSWTRRTWCQVCQLECSCCVSVCWRRYSTHARVCPSQCVRTRACVWMRTSESEWRFFRAAYAGLGDLRADGGPFSGAQYIAMTATANARTREEITRMLRMPYSNVPSQLELLIGNSDRENCM